MDIYLPSSTAIWCSLKEPDEYGKYTMSILARPADPAWITALEKMIKIAEAEDVALDMDDLLKPVGQWASSSLPDVHECDVALRLKTRHEPNVINPRKHVLSSGTPVTVKCCPFVYSFTNDEGEHLEGLSLRLNAIRVDGPPVELRTDQHMPDIHTRY